jgi:transcriptional regulator with XRE-family HTH domain
MPHFKTMNQSTDITPRQIRAARGLLDWSRETLAGETGVPMRTLARLESGEGDVRAPTIESVHSALTKAGIRLLGSSGVLLRSAGRSGTKDDIPSGVMVMPDGRSVAAFMTDLRKEISRRRQEAAAKRAQSAWKLERMDKVRLVQLIEWIECELDKFNPLAQNMPVPGEAKNKPAEPLKLTLAEDPAAMKLTVDPARRGPLTVAKPGKLTIAKLGSTRRGTR